MTLSPLQIVLGLLFLGACVYTVLGYPHKYGALTGRSRLFRSTGVVIIDLLLGLVLLYTFINFSYGATPRVAALRGISYLAACLFLTFALLCIALLDWLEGIVALRRGQRDIFRQITRPDDDEPGNND